jgi:two-component system chemotaxis response regulator CheY
MPVMGGLEMLEGLRALPGKVSIPAFVLTTESSKEMVARGKKCGATAWIVKPFKPEILIKGISHVLARARAAA